jgi:hypothetical protein
MNKVVKPTKLVDTKLTAMPNSKAYDLFNACLEVWLSEGVASGRPRGNETAACVLTDTASTETLHGLAYNS